MELPRRLQIEFSRVVQHHTDARGGEVSSDDMWSIFSDEYLKHETPLKLVRYTSNSVDEGYTVEAVVLVGGVEQTITGEGNGPLSAFVDALGSAGFEVRVLDYTEHALSKGGDATAAAYVECEVGATDATEVLWGVGMSQSIVTASMRAVVSAINRHARGE